MARYLGRAIVGFTLLVLAMFMVLLLVYLFAVEQKDVGVGSYTMANALWFSLLNLPRQIFDLLPIAALIGSLLALTSLARSSELTVMRAAGVSAIRLGLWAGVTGTAIAVSAWMIGDFVAPPLERMAREQKTFAKYKQISLTDDQGVWAKDGDTFISVQQQTTENQFGGLYVFRFDAERRLIGVGRATAARVTVDNIWELSDYAESVIQRQETPASADTSPTIGASIVASRVAKQTLVSNLTPEFLTLVATNAPNLLPGRTLLSVIRHNKANGLDTRVFETALWARIARTTALIFLVVLAVPFAVGGSPRSGGGGVRTLLGILVGTAFSLFAKLLNDGALVFQLAPVVVAWAPTALLAIVTMVALTRVR